MFLFCINSISALNNCEDLLALYNFDSDAIDYSSNNNHAKVNGAILSEGKVGNHSYYLNGVNNTIKISSVQEDELINFSKGTLSLWYKSNGSGLSSVPRLFSYYNAEDVFELTFYNNEHLLFIHRGDWDYKGDIQIPVESLLTDRNWHHVVIRWDVNGLFGTQNTLSIIYDGVESFDTDILRSSSRNTVDVFIGSNGDNLIFNGSIDEVIILDKVLNYSEALELYNTNTSLQCDNVTICIPECGLNQCGLDPVCGDIECGTCSNTQFCEGGACNQIDECGNDFCGLFETCKSDFCCDGTSYNDSLKCCDSVLMDVECCDNSDCGNGFFCEADICRSQLTCIDLDLDGFSSEGGDCGILDCNDNNNAINVGANEICDDLIDNNCDGFIDSEDVLCKECFPVFPGAQGFGTCTIAGRGGDIIKVTNLNDSGPGSFREAVQANFWKWADGQNYSYESPDVYKERMETEGHKIVVFNVSGIIDLKSPLFINKAFLTIAGETSPGGILLTGMPITISTHDVLIRHMRFRVGSHGCTTHKECEVHDTVSIMGDRDLGLNATYNIVIDHCSFSWGVDETLSTGWYNPSDITIQNSIVSEGLSRAGHPKGEHSKGLLISGKFESKSSVSIHNNYFAHNNGRNPLMASSDFVNVPLIDLVNNVIYNYGGSISIGVSNYVKINLVHNYIKAGLDSNVGSTGFYFLAPSWCSNFCKFPIIYSLGNLDSVRTSQSQDSWDSGIYANWDYPRVILDLNESYKKENIWPTLKIPTTEMSYDYALEILNDVGATKPFRDSVDARVVQDFIDGTGRIIDDVIYPDDYPSFQDLPAPVDSDDDGMSDLWETSTFGDLSKTNNGDEDNDGYTNIEEYLHYLAGDVVDEQVIVVDCDSDNDGLDSLNVSCGGTDCDDNDPSVLECHKADTSFDNCVSVTELASHLTLWMSSSSVSIRDVIGAEKVFKSCNS